MQTIVSMKWMPKNARPPRPGWHYVRETWPRLCVGVRYYDDSSGGWWAVSKDAKNDGALVPNETFFDWLNIPGISDRQSA